MLDLKSKVEIALKELDVLFRRFFCIFHSVSSLVCLWILGIILIRGVFQQSLMSSS